MIPREDKQVMMMSSIQDVSAQTQREPELSETRQRKSEADYFAKPGEADWGC
jgi:hypothetical protein